jgi:hypothetical protein
MPIPLHISPFTGPAGAPDLMGAVNSGLGMAERRKQGSFDRDLASKQFEESKQRNEEQRRQFNESHGVSEGYLDLQRSQDEERKKRKLMEEQSKLLEQFQHAVATGDYATAARLKQELERRELSFRPKAAVQPTGGQPAAPNNPFSMGAPKLDQPLY